MTNNDGGLMQAVYIVLALVMIAIVGGIGIYISDTVQDTTDSGIADETATATQTLTLTDNMVDNENVTINTIKFELNSAGAVTVNHVNVSTQGNLTKENTSVALAAAINNNATTSALVTASNPTGATVLITADTAGSAANAYATTETMANASWGASTMAGGIDISVVGAMQNNFLGAGQTGSSFIVILVIAFIGSIAMTYMFGMVGKKKY